MIKAAGMLLILFIALKLCKVITWSWWLVLSPMVLYIIAAGIVLLFIKWVFS